MDIYLTDTKGTRLAIPILPDRVNIKTGALTQSFQIIKVGEIKIPRGSSLTGYSWNGLFPGETMQDQVTSFGRTWEKPDNIVAQIDKWRIDGETLRLMITETIVNADVFIEQFNYEYFGMGHISYTITLSTKATLTVTTVPPPAKPPTPAPSTGTASSESSNSTATYGIVSTSGGTLNVRKSPSTSAAILGTLKNGSTIEIIGNTGNWYIIPHEKGVDKKGYVYKSYVKMKASASNTSSGSSSGKTNSSSSSGKSSSTSSSSSGSSGGYITKSGDTLYSIAKAFGVDYNALWSLNSSTIQKAGGSMSKMPVGIALQIPTKKKTTLTSNSSGSSSLLKKAASAVTSVVSKVATGVKSLLSKIPTAKVTSVSSKASKTTVQKGAAKKNITMVQLK